MTFTIEIHEGEGARRPGEITALAGEIFNGLDPDYIAQRLAHIADPLLVYAIGENGARLGFGVGYRRGATFYSWLGGVRPEARRLGVASALVAALEERAASAGYRHVETRTIAANNPMIILNLQAGYQITGFEMDARGYLVITQRKDLTDNSASAR